MPVVNTNRSSHHGNEREHPSRHERWHPRLVELALLGIPVNQVDVGLVFVRGPVFFGAPILLRDYLRPSAKIRAWDPSGRSAVADICKKPGLGPRLQFFRGILVEKPDLGPHLRWSSMGGEIPQSVLEERDLGFCVSALRLRLAPPPLDSAFGVPSPLSLHSTREKSATGVPSPVFCRRPCPAKAPRRSQARFLADRRDRRRPQGVPSPNLCRRPRPSKAPRRSQARIIANRQARRRPQRVPRSVSYRRARPSKIPTGSKPRSFAESHDAAVAEAALSPTESW